MNEALQSTYVGCPYCGESIEVVIEVLDESYEYIEDCQVCCRPIVFHVEISWSGEPTLSVRSENELF
ncbi:CPXCG motif-containing cysteine-rich protein [Marinomonas ostreistagni]|uniref:CPXCG motif-containing cysteine-rich protein n=1 Tax=Marinomonas ostreistagni TaxID=359209 RepID=UPI001951280F|nr:CPXCG motif-containing cysteine-rich protein [Marinomonas ostreistagni]MBM6550419.1 CPXCG motif-containing cysteine-rich protein [Marinomonas ostreistagni]